MEARNGASFLTVEDGPIPEELKVRDCWLMWRVEERNGKRTKPPYQVSGGAGKSNDPATWASFKRAWRAYARPSSKWDGIGFALAPEDEFTGVDLDHCIDPQTGEIREWALVIVRRLNSYTERSPSGHGLRIFLRAKLPPGGRVLEREGGGRIEVYDAGRYLTVTGHHFDGTPATVEARTDEVASWHAETFPAEEKRAEPAERPEPVPLDLSDEELLKVAFAAANGEDVASLWRGAWEGRYESQHRADAALCTHLAFYAQGDAGRIDRMFRASGLMRPKWDEVHYSDGRTYGEETIRREVALVAEYWKPPGSIRVFEAASRNGAEEPDPDAPRPLAGKVYLTTDVGNAERLVRSHGKNIRYCSPWRRWLIWDDLGWVPDLTGEICVLARATVKAIWREVSAADDEDQQKRLARHALESEKHRGISGMLAEAESMPGVPVLPRALDADPWKFGCGNGVLNLKSGKLLAARRDLLITKRTPVCYDASAECPLWLEFLNRIFAKNAALVGFIQRAMGYTLTGVTQERCLFICYGTGDNGKTVLLDVLQALMGEYGQRTSAETFMRRRSGSIPNDVAALKGARYVFASETEEGRGLAVALVKEVTGGEEISARFMRGEFFSFRPECKIWLATNHKPRISDSNRAIWNRIRLIPFLVTIPKAEQDRRLAERLKEELPGILVWAVEGCRDWRKGGLDEPAEVTAATESYRQEQDTIGEFLSQRCVLASKARVPVAALFEAYVAWSGDRGLSQREFGLKFGELGHEQKRGTGGIWEWRGVGLVSDQDADEHD